MQRLPGTEALRQLALAVSVLDGVELEPFGAGLVLRDGRPLEVSWDEAAAALGADGLPDVLDLDDTSSPARRRLRRHLQLRRALDEPGAPDRVRALALPTGSAAAPGPGWARTRVLGGATEVGPGLLGLLPGPEVVPLSPVALAASGRGGDVDAVWADALVHAEAMGELAGERLLREPRVLVPVGHADVVTLLSSRSFRSALAAGCPTGMRAVVVPMRRRGWVDPSHLDPAFVGSVAALVEEDDRAFPRPLLVTADELVLVRAGGRPERLALDGISPRPQRVRAERPTD
ncbi:hypothetical protein [Motilibacter aurantiacus]|uniref:hypothetical protein n=1 Tax=Motilibacter aurantiacus TaxID=2714955 RepID=UPI00140ADACD|nr:hypothetical protein [Motilibacter aurantiacus]NHC46136.1 hypothetical protein [Motilibacter aurantiacus]